MNPAPDLAVLTRWTRALAALAAAVVLATAGLLALGADRAEAQPTASDWYTVQSRHSGLVLDIQGVSTATGALVTQYTATGGTNQQFRFIDVGNGYYAIQARHSGLVLDVSGASTADGASVIQWTRHDGENQQWKVTRDTAGYYSIVNRRSGKALDVHNWSTSAGSQIVQYAPTGAANQQWSLNPAGATCGADTVFADIAAA
jgi:hypothetical protein